MSAETVCVVGSGPAGATAAYFLWQAGFDVTVLDGGLMPEPEVASDIADWHKDQDDEKLISAATRRAKASQFTKPELAEKLFHGSDFVYRDTDRMLLAGVEGADIRTSLALGGLSNVWGAASLPITARDIVGWPITYEDLAPHFEALDEIIEICGENDGLSSLFGGNVRPPTFALGLQGAALLKDLTRRHETLAARGMVFGRARVAVGRKYSQEPEGCVACGHCMIGCPHRAIFNAAFIVESLRGRERFTYRGGCVVDRVAEDDECVSVQGRGLADDVPFDEKFARVFVAAGAVSTTAIISRSRPNSGAPIKLRDTQHFVFPLMRFRGTKDATIEKTNRLAQAFVEIDDPTLCDHLVHLQLYGYNDIFMDALKEKLGAINSVAPFAINLLARHAMIIQGFLHSDYSGSVNLSFSRSGKIQLTGEPNAQAPKIARNAQKSIARSWREFGGIPIPGQIIVPPPGASRHLGASLPMSATPTGNETDTLGRPVGLSRVHAVDASVLPSIPASTITYSAMANAARIVDQVAQLSDASA
ncbi:MAG: NAD(P)-binding protein [Alphaproteobacteria bacterium]|nr:NAD(P)-binding protein [Alphaproteobacteria bacterium]